MTVLATLDAEFDVDIPGTERVFLPAIKAPCGHMHRVLPHMAKNAVRTGAPIGRMTYLGWFRCGFEVTHVYFRGR